MQPQTLTERERIDWLRLMRSENVGPITFRQLIERFGTAARALDALPALSRKGGKGRTLAACTPQAAEAELTALAKIGGRLIAFCEPDYPPILAAIEDAPPAITVRGRLALLARPKVAIVGARNASTNGRRIAEDLGRQLAEHGYAVVSGMARGIDAAAHAGGLRASPALPGHEGGTIAVMAGGIDILYPPENAELFARLGKEGLIVGELPPGSVPQARHFPRRNRIISGLAAGTVVVEAALRSGSLITARFALEQGRDLMAVPGSPLDPRARGCNHLIREGAVLVENAEQVIACLESFRLPQQSGMRPGISTQHIDIISENEMERWRRIILGQLGPSPVGVDELLRQCQCSPSILGLALLELDLAGRLERLPGNRISLIAAGLPIDS